MISVALSELYYRRFFPGLGQKGVLRQKPIIESDLFAGMSTAQGGVDESSDFRGNWGSSL